MTRYKGLRQWPERVSPQQRPRIYFCCHPDDFRDLFEPVASEILEAQGDAIIWYYDPVDGIPSGADFLGDLMHMQLFVVPVTSRFVYQESQARSVELPLATEHHIPVLPIMWEDIPLGDFSAVCGSLHALDRFASASDPTAIPYRERLRSHLQSVLVGDELAERVRAAFDAYVFLSYRKRDRAAARELMRLIHMNELCRDIAIWYDEFLRPGEDFDDAILDALAKCSVFTLVVTPHLLEVPNYVLREEYPAAVCAQKPILPIEMEATDAVELARLYGGIGSPLPGKDAEGVGKALVETLRGIALRENDADPVHNYLIGLAYLSGIDVERDYWRALELITSAAEGGLFEACKRLASIHGVGHVPGLQPDFPEAVRWERECIRIILDDEARPPAERAATLAEEYEDLASLLYVAGEEELALEAYAEMIGWAERLNELGHSEGRQRLVDAYATVAWRLIFADDPGAACELLDKAERVLDGGTPPMDAALAQQAKVEIRMLRGDACGGSDTPGAIGHYSEALSICRSAQAWAGDPTLLEQEDALCMRLGAIYLSIGETHKARELYERSADILPLLAADSRPSKWQVGTLFRTLADICRDEGDLRSAAIWYGKSATYLEALYAQTARVDDGISLADAYRMLGDCHRALGDQAEAHSHYQRCLSVANGLGGGKSLALLRCTALAHYWEGRLEVLSEAERLLHIDSARLAGIRLREATDDPFYDRLVEASSKVMDALLQD